MSLSAFVTGLPPSFSSKPGVALAGRAHPIAINANSSAKARRSAETSKVLIRSQGANIVASVCISQSGKCTLNANCDSAGLSKDRPATL